MSSEPGTEPGTSSAAGDETASVTEGLEKMKVEKTAPGTSSATEGQPPPGIKKESREDEGDSLPDFKTKRCHGGCETCPDLIRSRVFPCISSVTGKTFDCEYNFEEGEDDKKKSYLCKLVNIVYLLTCKSCKMQYVGQTIKELHDRVSEHRRDIRNWEERGDHLIWEHFRAGACHNPFIFTIQILEKLKGNGRLNKVKEDEKGEKGKEDPKGEEDPKGKEKRRQAQKEWILKLETMYPYGLNYEKVDVNYTTMNVMEKKCSNAEEIVNKLVNMVEDDYYFRIWMFNEIRSLLLPVEQTPLLKSIAENYITKIETRGNLNPLQSRLDEAIRDLLDYKLGSEGRSGTPKK